MTKNKSESREKFMELLYAWAKTIDLISVCFDSKKLYDNLIKQEKKEKEELWQFIESEKVKAQIEVLNSLVLEENEKISARFRELGCPEESKYFKEIILEKLNKLKTTQ